eukprot:3369554-Prymnesium_polylepis.1
MAVRWWGDCEGRRVAPPPVSVDKRYSGPGAIPQSDATRDIERLVLVDHFCLKRGGDLATMRPFRQAFTSCHPGGIPLSDAPRDIASKARALAPHAHAHHVRLAILH